jgi:4-aminobutyrate aminotransferase-like enzyme
MVKGKGATLTDSTGKEYLDFVAGIFNVKRVGCEVMKG